MDSWWIPKSESCKQSYPLHGNRVWVWRKKKKKRERKENLTKNKIEKQHHERKITRFLRPPSKKYNKKKNEVVKETKRTPLMEAQMASTCGWESVSSSGGCTGVNPRRRSSSEAENWMWWVSVLVCRCADVLVAAEETLEGGTFVVLPSSPPIIWEDHELWLAAVLTYDSRPVH